MRCLCWPADRAARAFAQELHGRRGEPDEEDAAAGGRLGQRERLAARLSCGCGCRASLRAQNSSLCTPARRGERGEANGGCRADVLPARHQPADLGNAEEIQQREAHHIQHLPVLPEGDAAASSPPPASRISWSSCLT